MAFKAVIKPQNDGLYSPEWEHDACGVGFVANIKGEKSHSIIENALGVLRNLAHRGATGWDSETGDGAGILIQIPHHFFHTQMLSQGVELPEPGHYGVGMIFLPPELEERQKYEQIVNETIAEEGQYLLGWRDVPVDNSQIGETLMNQRHCSHHLRIVEIQIVWCNLVCH